ncbi:autotransporter domain-containing protein [Nitratireductor sp. StC3]|uniref:autotransporter domain-containing protein n=1 Tax=Nitratireductor sp. StC3 TaxID=2126741 RepID=UPI000D0D6834|nr:autotransporter domain-containing protein [Nitratireductor sp. StC3]PSM16685.1 hypothetical protein C7T96_18580 [Nitratireductor sp. StC3]
MPAYGANITWSGATNSDWQEATNWVGGVAPGAGDAAFIGTDSPAASIDGYGVNIQDLRVPDTGDGELSIINAGTLDNAAAFVGTGVGSTGTVTVDGDGSRWAGTGHLYVGFSGSGYVTIQNSGDVESDGSIYLGRTADGYGEVTVTGAGSSMSGDNALYVGHTGSALMNVVDGATVDAATTLIGELAGADGEILLRGAGSTLTSPGQVIVGNSGIGILDVEDGASVDSGGNFYVGLSAGSTGEVTVSDAGSEIRHTGQLQVGRTGTGTLTIEDGGAVTATSSLQVGVLNGSDGTLDILSGGTLDNATGYIGNASGSTGTVTVDGAGSLWTSTGDIHVGYNGSGYVTIQNGGDVESDGHIYLARTLGGYGEVTVTGAGSSMSSDIALWVGFSNTGSAVFNVLDGATVTNLTTRIGEQAGASGQMLVRGAGSQLITSSHFVVGTSGTGVLDIEDGAAVDAGGVAYVGQSAGGDGTINILGGANLESASGIAGHSAGATGDVIVDGAGSSWVNTGTLTVGNNGSGTLIVRNGATTSAATTLIVSSGNGSDGLMEIRGGGMVTSTTGRLGNIAGSDGEVLIAGTGSSWTNTGAMSVGHSGTGELTLSDDGTLDVDGTLTIASAGGSTGTLNIGAAEGDAAAAPGIIDAGAINFGSGTGEIVFNHTGTNYTFAPGISGNGTLTFEAGHTILSGDSSGFAGTVAISDARISLSGEMGGTMTFGSGSRFDGTGSAGSVVFDNGSTVAPGNSIGTTPVVNATFNPGSTYEVEINSAGQSDLLDASGTVTINGGTVQVIPFPDFALGTAYTIITADGGVAGAFDTLTTPATVNGVLTYGANNVFLTLSGNAAVMQARARSRNQLAVAGASGNAGANGAVSALYLVSGDVATRAALDALSGEVHASLSAAQIREQRSLRDIALRRPQGRKDTKDGSPYWVEAFATDGWFKGDGNSASADTAHGGMMAGFEAELGDDGHFGVGIGYSQSLIDVDGRASTATSRNLHALIYGGEPIGETGLDIEGGASLTFHDIGTDRDTSFSGFDGQSGADYSAQTGQIFARISRPIGNRKSQLRPHLDGAYIVRRSGSFGEDGEAGLEADAQTDHIGLATLGIDGAHRIETGDGTATLRAGVGWQHVIGNTGSEHSHAFRDAPASEFDVRGIDLPRDTVLFNAGVAFTLEDTVDITFEYRGALANEGQEHGLSARAGMRF